MGNLIIVGAGMAGLLAANLLRHHDPVIVEEQEGLPNNHHAVLRFGSPAVGDALGIPFREVTLVKHALEWKNPVADILAYSDKVGGRFTTDRSVSRRNAEISKRWIAPRDLIMQMALRCDIRYGCRWEFKGGGPKVISTIPMPALTLAMQYPSPPDFSYRHGWVVSAQVAGDCDAYATIVVPNPSIQFYRASITGDLLLVECIEEPMDGVEEEAAHLLGVKVSPGTAIKRRQGYAKIMPVNDVERRRFIFWASSVKGVAYSLGRFATWRPGLLTEDLIKDIRLIDGWIREGEASRYSMELHEADKKGGMRIAASTALS